MATKSQEAHDALSGSVLFNPRHCFIPATSALGLTGFPRRPLEHTTAADTPFDAIYAEPAADPGNRSHVHFDKHAGKLAFNTEIRRIMGTPSIKRVDPPDLPEGSPGLGLKIEGINFTPDTDVLWNGEARETTFISDTEVVVGVLPSDLQDPGVSALTLEDMSLPFPLGGLDPFLFPVVDVGMTVSPAAPAPGVDVQVCYDGLWRDGNVPENHVVSVDGNAIRIDAVTPNGNTVFVFSPYSFKLGIGPLPAGDYTVTYFVDNGFNVQEVESREFSVVSPSPAVTGLDPPEVRSASEEIVFRIRGENFLRDPFDLALPLTEVHWNGTPVPVTVLGATEIVAEVPEGLVTDDALENTLEVVNPGAPSLVSLEVPFSGPVVRIVEVANDSPSEGTLRLTVGGNNLGEGATVYWDGDPLPTVLDDEGRLVSVISEGHLDAPGSSAVTVGWEGGAESSIFYFDHLVPEEVIFVKQGTPDGGDGESWSSAFDDLQDALAAAETGDEIWVAAGMYVPQPGDSPAVSFDLVDGVAVLGTNVLFAGNSGRYGAGLRCLSNSSVTAVNSTFAHNVASESAGAILIESGAVTAHNSIFWGNTSPDAAISGAVNLSAASSRNTIEAGHPTGAGTLTGDPLFVRAPGPGDGDWGSVEDNDYGNLRLRTGSPAVDAGEDTVIPAGVTVDLGGGPRTQGTAVDHGAYEGSFRTFADSYPGLGLSGDANNDGWSNGHAYLLGVDPEGAPVGERQPRLILEGDQVFVEVVYFPDAGDLGAVYEQTGNLADWFRLPGGSEFSGNSAVVDRVELLGNGIQQVRFRLLVPADAAMRRFVRMSAALAGY